VQVNTCIVVLAEGSSTGIPWTIKSLKEICVVADILILLFLFLSKLLVFIKPKAMLHSTFAAYGHVLNDTFRKDNITFGAVNRNLQDRALC